MDPIQQIDKALAAHEQWKSRLLHAIETKSSEFSQAQVESDHACEFGKWLYGADAAVAGNPHHERVRALHERFHRTAGEILALALAGDTMKARIALGFGGEFAKASLRLVTELNEWQVELRGTTTK